MGGLLIAHTHKEYEDIAVRLALMGADESGNKGAGGRALVRSLCDRCACEGAVPARRRESCPLVSDARVTDLEHAAQGAYEVKRALLQDGRAVRPSHVVVVR